MRLSLPLSRIILDYLFRSARGCEQKRTKFVETFLGSLPPGSRLLDVGAGPQKYRRSARHLHYTSQDLCEYDGYGDGAGFQNGSWDTRNIDIVSDICSIPVDDSTFDAAICTDVLEHVPNAWGACRELHRIVKPGGKILITVPTQCDTHQSPYFFSGGYSIYFFSKVFSERRVSVEFESGYFETVDQKICLGLVMLGRLAKQRSRYWLALAITTVLALPLVAAIRLLPTYGGNTGCVGLLVVVSKET